MGRKTVSMYLKVKFSVEMLVLAPHCRVREQLKYNLGILTVRLYENVRKTVYQQHREFIDEIDEMSEEHPPEWIETAKEWVRKRPS